MSCGARRIRGHDGARELLETRTKVVAALQRHVSVFQYVDSQGEKGFPVEGLAAARAHDDIHPVHHQARHGAQVERRSAKHMLHDQASVVQRFHVGAQAQGLAVEVIRFPAQLDFEGRSDSRRVGLGGDFGIDHEGEAGVFPQPGIEHRLEEMGSVAGRSASAIIRRLVDDDGMSFAGPGRGQGLFGVEADGEELFPSRGSP